MSVQQLRMGITIALEQYFPDVPVVVDEGTTQGTFFQPRLISVTYERQRESRTVAIYRFGIRYKGGNPLEAEEMVDQLQEALERILLDGGSNRGNRQIWAAGEEGNDPLFTVEYTLHLQNEKSEAVMMGHVIGGERLK
ncbi:phage tail terminator family protein [Paenibacillus wynnii]|uniref:phage tail terminator family protein n=1 Tax=Paenibacillus wynnii TaxID=268407 RepID=UPI0027921513|nr:hypothetical protein [Paenibacillus wynnii]MDQ0195795.1 hypothetical protein [Paenibacillus wynnii]